MANDHEDKRVHPRFPLDAEIRIAKPELTGRTTNVSFGGLALTLEAAKELRLGERLEFTLDLDEGPLELMGSLCWRSGSVVGLSFDGLVREQRLAVSALVDRARAAADVADS